MTQIQTESYISTEEFVKDLNVEFPILKTFPYLKHKLHLLCCVCSSSPCSSTIFYSHTGEIQLFNSPKFISNFLAEYIRGRFRVIIQLIQDCQHESILKKDTSLSKITKFKKVSTVDDIKEVLASYSGLFIRLSRYINSIELKFNSKEYCPFLSNYHFLQRNVFRQRYNSSFSYLSLLNQLHGIELHDKLDGYSRECEVYAFGLDFNNVFRIDSNCYTVNINYGLKETTYTLMVDKVFPNLEEGYNFEKIKGGVFLNDELSYEPYYFLKQPLEIPLTELLVKDKDAHSVGGKITKLDQKIAALKKALENNWITTDYLNDKSELQVSKTLFHEMLNKLDKFTAEERSLFGAGCSDFFRPIEVRELIKTRQGRPSNK